MYTITETYRKNYVRISKRYRCECGHKFTRLNSRWFTMNPFNKKSYRECYDEYKEELNVLKRNCPKCGKEIAPVNSDANIATEQVSVPDLTAAESGIVKHTS